MSKDKGLSPQAYQIMDGDKYHLEWYPDSDSWEIILTLDDLMDE